jgi:hypothetical protein
LRGRRTRQLGQRPDSRPREHETRHQIDDRTAQCSDAVESIGAMAQRARQDIQRKVRAQAALDRVAKRPRAAAN